MVLNEKGFQIHIPNKYRIFFFVLENDILVYTYIKKYIIQFSMNCYWMKYFDPFPPKRSESKVYINFFLKYKIEKNIIIELSIFRFNSI